MIESIQIKFTPPETEKNKAAFNKYSYIKMISSSSPSTQSPRVTRHHNGSENDMVDITLPEKIRITRKQYEVLKIVCDTYQKSVSEYMQEALVEVMRTDIEEGNFCDALLDKLGGDSQKEEKRYDGSPQSYIGNDMDSLQF
jgi:hypothetical protein